MNSINLIPNRLLGYLLSFLDLKEKIQCTIVCKKFKISIEMGLKEKLDKETEPIRSELKRFKENKWISEKCFSDQISFQKKPLLQAIQFLSSKIQFLADYKINQKLFNEEAGSIKLDGLK